MGFNSAFKGLNAELNPNCHLLALLGTHHILHVSRIRVTLLKPSSYFTYHQVWYSKILHISLVAFLCFVLIT